MTDRTLPEDALIILPVRSMVLFPGIVVPLAVGRDRSRAAAQEAVRLQRPLGVLLQAQPDTENPKPDELHWVGTSADVLRYLTSEGTHHAVVKGRQRFRVVQWLEGYPFMAARVQLIDEIGAGDAQVEGRARALRERAVEILTLLPQVPQEMVTALEGVEGASALADFIAGMMDVGAEEKQALLETFDLKARLDKLLDLLTHRIEVLKVSKEVNEKTRESIDDANRKHLLREQMRAIQKELGEDEGGTAAEFEELEKRIDESGMPEDVEKQARKELKRLQRMPDGSGENGMIRSYLEWLVDLPWKDEPQAAIDIVEARKVLDDDHFGLEKIKRRILEYLAVRKLNPSGKSPILCFVGPPGVGKTSLGQSIARATGRKFVRVSLGGTHDEAEIRGHRRTYIGALPGNIIQSLKKAGSKNTVMMLDEIDKLGMGGFHGDPSSALLEVLDPEQNSTFRDNYLAVPYDLSKVMFIATANMLDTIPGPLRDRMEVIQLPGYTAQEKLQIAKRYLVARQLESAGIKASQAELTGAALLAIINDYTREAGVRNLEREIGNVIRHVAVKVAEGQAERMTVDEADLASILGPRKFEAEVAMRSGIPGVATGLAWTPVGGDILFIEATRVPGSGKLILTGQLGDVMKESAQAALTLVKARADRLHAHATGFDKIDIHMHIPAGAIPKDGPSAGVAMFVALSSLVLDKAVRHDCAMTGEISLRGLVLPVGGIKEKVLAALAAGIRTVLLPARNRKDLEEIPADARKRLEFVWLETVDDALRAAMGIDSPVPERAH